MTKEPQDLTETELEDAKGGMLLPAVQMAREAARRTSSKKGFVAESTTDFATKSDQ